MKRVATAAALLAVVLCAGAPARGEGLGFAADSEVATKVLAVTATTGRTQVRTGAGSRYVRIFNSGTVAVFVSCGDVTILAVATTSLPIGPGAAEVIGCGQQYVAAVTSTTATIYLTPGNLP